MRFPDKLAFQIHVYINEKNYYHNFSVICYQVRTQYIFLQKKSNLCYVFNENVYIHLGNKR